jgi:hypothetical protein
MKGLFDRRRDMETELLRYEKRVSHTEILRCNFDIRKAIEDEVLSCLRKHVADYKVTLEKDIDVIWYSEKDEHGHDTGRECCVSQADVSMLEKY